MKICIVSRNINSDYTGNFEFDQAMALKDAGHDVYVLSMDLRSLRRKRKFGFYMDEFNGIKIMRCSVPVGPVKPAIFNLIGSRIFVRGYKKLKKNAGCFDIVNTHFLNISYIVLYALKEIVKENVPMVVTEHLSLMNVDRNQISDINIMRGEYVYNNADRVIAVSNALAEKIKNNFGVDSDVVFNVFDGRIFDGRERNHEDDENFTFVSAGNLTQNKRMSLLVRTFSKAFPEDVHTRLYIFGDGPERSRLERQIEELNLEDRVFIMGRKTRAVLADFYANADAFALLSKRETFGVAYIEAMASGMPVLACRSGGPEDFIIPEVGMFTDDNEEDVVSALKSLKADRSSYDDSFIKEYAGKICSGQVIAGQLTEIFNSLIK